ncbi:MAG TPA: exodeoxyribonuclease III [Clostridiales bacterium]|nr:exodeoxyribonuclease III [Clostridiales bacterium]HQP70988.1 exodeoxyribonuclease III [Clostridiales bacterium]
MKVYSWNVNGLRAVAKKSFFDWIAYESPDILFLQETKLQEETLPPELKNIENYHSYFSHAEKKGYSGTGVYTKKEPDEVSYGMGIKEFDSEGRIVKLRFGKVIMFNIYFPNGQMNEDRLKYKLDFYDALLDHLEALRKQGYSLLISGDYNTAHNEIDLKNAKANENYSGFLRIERDWLDKLVKTGYVDTFRTLYPDKVQYSWWSYRFNARKNNTGWRIDYHFVNKEFFPKVKDSYIMNDVYGSDHCPIVVELDI